MRGTSVMDHYLYALIEGLPPARRPPAAGRGVAAVTVRRCGDRPSITAAMDAVPPSAPRTLAARPDVVASTLDAHAVLTFRYATIAGALGPEGWLASRRE